MYGVFRFSTSDKFYVRIKGMSYERMKAFILVKGRNSNEIVIKVLKYISNMNICNRSSEDTYDYNIFMNYIEEFKTSILMNRHNISFGDNGNISISLYIPRDIDII